MPTGHEHGSGGAANSVCVSLREAHAVSGDSVNRRRVQVLRTEAVGVKRALVVCQYEDNIGTANAPARTTAAEGRTAKKCRACSLQKIASCVISIFHVIAFHG